MTALAAPLDIDAAVAKANEWTDTARPILRAWARVGDAYDEIYIGVDDRARDDMEDILDKARADLRDLADMERDEAISVAYTPYSSASDAEWEAWESLDNALADRVTTLSAALSQAERELVEEALA